MIKRRKTLTFPKLWKSWWLSETCCGRTKANAATAWSPEIEDQGPSSTARGFENPHPHSDHPGNKCPASLERGTAGAVLRGQDCLIYAQVTKHTSISTDCIGKQVGKEGSTRQIWLALLTHIGCSWWMNRSPWQLGIKCWVRIIPPKAAAERVFFVNTTIVLYTPQICQRNISKTALSVGPEEWLSLWAKKFSCYTLNWCSVLL